MNTPISALALAASLLATGLPTLVQAQQRAPSVAPNPAAPPARARAYADIAPKLANLTDEVLYGDVWERPQLSKRDRSLVTVSALIALNRPDQLRSHLAIARQNGVTQDELIETITHLAFYSGWPNAVTAVGVARDVFKAEASAAAGPPGAAAPKDSITVVRARSLPPVPGPPDNFTGSVRVESRFQRPAPARIGGGVVHFDAGARTNWHTHALGQTLFVSEGVGYVQQWGGPVQEIRPGDVVWIPPGVKHWHGATRRSGMTHLAITEASAGGAVAWLEPVSDAQYPR